MHEQQSILYLIKVPYWLGAAADSLWVVGFFVPSVFGLFVVTLFEVLAGNTFQIWILIKTALLFIAMIMSYVLAAKVAKQCNGKSVPGHPS